MEVKVSLGQHIPTKVLNDGLTDDDKAQVQTWAILSSVV